MSEKITKQRVLIDLGLSVIGFLIGVILIFYFVQVKQPHLVESENFGGSAPVNIYQVYDKDTGVYYAVTSGGGICVMETMDGSTKLVDEGEPPVVHKNKGENTDAA